jgi:archaemetzincin
MNPYLSLVAVILAGMNFSLVSAADKARDTAAATEGLPPSFARLLPLHTPLGKPEKGEWLAEHEEPGQTYAQFLASNPNCVARDRRTIYVQPLGDFDATQTKILKQTADYLRFYFQLPVKMLEGLPLKVIPETAQRDRPDLGWKQIRSTYVLDHVLRPRLPRDACAYIALTTSDLWPGEGWNFVFGQASLSDRVGVWSIHRNGDPHGSDAAYQLCLRRTLKTATHESGHMFSMQHCVYYECNMCGSNHRQEADRQPLWLCPICLGKLCHATGADPLKRYEALVAFCKEHGLKEEAEFLGGLEGRAVRSGHQRRLGHRPHKACHAGDRPHRAGAGISVRG